jgi:hypothetical protein
MNLQLHLSKSFLVALLNSSTLLEMMTARRLALPSNPQPIDSSYIPHQHYKEPSPPYSEKPPNTPGLRVQSTGKSRYPSYLERILLKFFVEWWMLEILSWCFSAMCMGTIICMLMVHNGQGIPNWPLGLTINGFISVFSNFAKSALLLSTAEALGQLKWSKFSSFFVCERSQSSSVWKPSRAEQPISP